MRTGTSKPQTHITDPEEQRRHTELASQTVWTLREKKKKATPHQMSCALLRCTQMKSYVCHSGPQKSLHARNTRCGVQELKKAF